MRTVIILLTFLLTGCEPALPQAAPDAGSPVDIDGGAGFVAQINASNSRFWVGFNLDTGKEVSFDPPEWDLAFSRFHVRARGGASGDGGVEVAVLLDAGFDEVSSIPVGGFLVDQPDGEDTNTELDTVFESPESWYSYDVMTHVLSAKPTVYVVRSDENVFYKVHLEQYYDAAGTPGIITLRWQKLP